MKRIRYIVYIHRRTFVWVRMRAYVYACVVGNERYSLRFSGEWEWEKERSRTESGSESNSFARRRVSRGINARTGKEKRRGERENIVRKWFSFRIGEMLVARGDGRARREFDISERSFPWDFNEKRTAKRTRKKWNPVNGRTISHLLHRENGFFGFNNPIYLTWIYLIQTT